MCVSRLCHVGPHTRRDHRGPTPRQADGWTGARGCRPSRFLSVWDARFLRDRTGHAPVRPSNGPKPLKLGRRRRPHRPGRSVQDDGPPSGWSTTSHTPPARPVSGRRFGRLSPTPTPSALPGSGWGSQVEGTRDVGPVLPVDPTKTRDPESDLWSPKLEPYSFGSGVPSSSGCILGVGDRSPDSDRPDLRPVAATTLGTLDVHTGGHRSRPARGGLRSPGLRPRTPSPSAPGPTPDVPPHQESLTS